MKKIAITGGKGGVGKSTFSILLANDLREKGKKVILADLDVEGPNDHLLLGGNLKKAKEKVFSQLPELDREKCRKCGLCVKACQQNAIFQAPGEYPVFIDELCAGCGLCWNICPFKAIGVRKKIIGEVFENKIDKGFYLVTGRTKGVVEEAGPIVSQARAYALALASKTKADYLLIDTAAGMHCNVIRALLEADLVYAVTEATPLGAHDLKLILKLLKILKLPVKTIINQADLGRKQLIAGILGKEKVYLEKEIPFSQKLSRAYCRGSLLNFSFASLKNG